MQILEALHRLDLPWDKRENQAAITQAYKRKMMEYHPDKNASSQSTTIAQLINEAKTTLLEELSCKADIRRRLEILEAKLQESEARREALNKRIAQEAVEHAARDALWNRLVREAQEAREDHKKKLVQSDGLRWFHQRKKARKQE